ncbi:MAG: ABC transporter permease subunit [Coprobacillus sp.]
MDIVRTTNKGTGFKYLTFIILAIVIFIGSVGLLQLDFTKFITRLVNIGEVVSRMLVFDITLVPSILAEVLVSICLALTSLIVGAMISFVLAALAAENLTPNKYLSSFIKGFVAVIRSIPALVWILMVVASVGFGNTGGMIGLIFPTVGYLTKSFAASLEEAGYDKVEALKATGANWINIVLRGVVVETTPQLISWLAMRFENNIAEGISLGMVGVGGVGYLLNKAIMKFDYPSISTIIVVIFVTMFIFEIVTVRIKKQLHTSK